MITFKDLIQQVKFNDVKSALLEFSPDQKDAIEGYEKVFNELLTLSPVKKEEEEWILDIRWVKGLFEEDEPYIDVSGLWINSSDPEQHWALEFTRWEEWLSMGVVEAQVAEFGTANYIAHCLWEMTFDGFDQETIQEHIQELERRVEETKLRELVDIEVESKDLVQFLNDKLNGE